jgi:hypothetical protein
MRESSGFPDPLPVAVGARARARARWQAPPTVSRPTPATKPAKRPRERRIDVFRGLALAMIFIDHVPGTVFEHATSRNFGFSDAAEIFVFLSGTSAALAYSGLLEAPRGWPGVARIWRRAWTLYVVHIVVTVWVLAVAAALARFAGNYGLIARDNMGRLYGDLTGVLTGLPVLTHQLGYVNILPLYAVLLLVAPAVIPAARVRPWAVLAGSLGLWALAGLTRLNLPNYPAPGGRFLNPFSWQLLFVLGLLTGLRLKRGERLVPRWPGLIAASAAMLALALVWLKLPPFGHAANAVLGQLAAWGAPPLLRDFDKGILSLPRLLHVLALVYLVSSLPVFRRLCDSPRLEFLALMGRQALPVFALGTVLAFLGRAAKEMAPPSLLLDSAIIACGLMLLWLTAALIERGRRAARAQPA